MCMYVQTPQPITQSPEPNTDIISCVNVTPTTDNSPTALITPCSASTSVCSDFSSASHSTQQIPDHWRPEVESCLKDEMLTPSARNEIIRTLVSQLFSRANKPSRGMCEEYARKLILRYPFLKDDMGNGYVSYEVCRYMFDPMHLNPWPGIDMEVIKPLRIGTCLKFHVWFPIAPINPC